MATERRAPGARPVPVARPHAMTQDQVERYIAFVGYGVQLGSAVLLCGLFYLLRQHAARRVYFSIWARAWLVMGLAMAVVIAYNAPVVVGNAIVEPGSASFMAVRFSYQFTKILAAALFVIGTRAYAFGPPAPAAFGWGTAGAAVAGLAAAFLLDPATRAVVMQAPLIVLALGYCAWTLLTLPHSRRSLGSRVTGATFGVMALLWCLWFLSFNHTPLEDLPTLAAFVAIASAHNGYVDGLMQMLVGSGMIVMLMEDGKREADDARAELAVAHDKLRRDALYDSLTGSLNRRAYTEGVGLEMARATFGAVVVLDMDNLKTVNDTAGHAGGDELLQHLAGTLRTVVRPSDRLYRWGGDEFLLLFPGARGADVQARVEQAIAEAPPLTLAGLATPVRLVASVGSADYASAEDLAAAIERADGVMYRQKKARRTKERDANQVTPLPVMVKTASRAGE